MGLSIHYRGMPKRADLIQPLAEEVADICGAMAWKHHHICDAQSAGIVVSPESCEPVVLCLRHDGVLVSPFLPWASDAGAYLFTKTQYAGMDVHMAVIRLLRYLEAKYFYRFELIDEGGFWETDDEDHLREVWMRYESAINAVGGMLREFKTGKEKDAAILADRMGAFLRGRISG